LQTHVDFISASIDKMLKIICDHVVKFFIHSILQLLFSSSNDFTCILGLHLLVQDDVANVDGSACRNFGCLLDGCACHKKGFPVCICWNGPLPSYIPFFHLVGNENFFTYENTFHMSFCIDKIKQYSLVLTNLNTSYCQA